MSDTTPVFEPFNNGLVTSRDPATLSEGELSLANESIYLPSDISIQKVRGRTKYVTNALAAAVKGLRYIEFDDFTNQILAYSGTMYYRDGMSSSETGSTDFTALISNVTDGDTTGTSGDNILTTTTTNGFRDVRVGYEVSSSGGQIPASTTVVAIISTTSVQLSANLTLNITVSDTVTFTATVGNGSTLEAIQYNNKHYLLNGISNFVLENVSNNALTTRPHGLIAVTEPPTVAEITGHWAQSLGIGFWFFFTTEVLSPGTENEVESTNTVEATRIPYTEITSSDLTSGKTIEVTRPTLVNANATHWRVYGAVNKDAPTAPPVSSFQIMGQQEITATKALAGDVTLHAAKFATAIHSATSWSFSSLALNASDNKFTTTNTSGASLQVDTFAIGTVSSTFSGFEVNVRIGVGNPSNVAKSIAVECTLVYGATPTSAAAQTQIISVDKYTASYQTLKFGGNTDTWGREYTAWASADVTDANFGVKIIVGRVGDSSMPTVLIDSVEVRVYTTATSSTIVNIGSFFPIVSVSVGGIISVLGSNSPPPIATTGDVFDSQLVLNDTSDLSIIRYSLPDQPEYFPSVYFINFETKHTDEVTNIGRIGNVLVVGLRNNIYRVNYLPRESDAEFDRGRCYEPLAEGFGIVGTHASTNITLPGGNVVRAFVSYSGLHITNGFEIQTWTDDIDWYGTVSTPAFESATDYLKNCILVDYPVNYQLWMFYTPLGGTVNTKAFVFHYHPMHTKNGKPKITGPITVNTGAACGGRIAGMPIMVTGGDTGFASGKVFIEDRGYVDNSITGTPNVSGWNVRTRELYLAGMGRSFTINTTYVRHRANTTSTVSVTPRRRFIGEAQSSVTAKTFTTTNGGAPEVHFSMDAESVDFAFAESGDTGQAIRLIGISMELVGTGLTERR